MAGFAFEVYDSASDVRRRAVAGSFEPCVSKGNVSEKNFTSSRIMSACRYRANEAHIRPSRPDSGLGLSHKFSYPYESFPLRSEAADSRPNSSHRKWFILSFFKVNSLTNSSIYPLSLLM